MAVYKIFPSKDTTLYSNYYLSNTGRDEILEISTEYYNEFEKNEVSRALISFDNDDLNKVYNKIGTSSFDSYLRLFLANASNIPLDYSIECYPISQNWDMGVGKFGDVPATIIGASWKSPIESGSDMWTLSGSYITSSYLSTGSNGSIGGGSWYYSYSSSIFNTSQSFTYFDDKDINLKVTDYINLFRTGSINNNGFIVKLTGSLEYNNKSINLKYYSIDTHTIYPPCLEFKWNDFVYNTGSLGNVSSKCIVTINNNFEKFYEKDVINFTINSRERYPTRTFSTSSVYLNNKYLPKNSYWALKDVDTEEMVVDFDEVYTKISANSEGNYFTLYMDGLEPERYYQILIKSIFDNGEIHIFNNLTNFKVYR